ncbi:hypothetical protein AB0M22_44410 [Nocardia sp. NPDC051756]|uniref:hypothetical protein n=1 Tax=Nocardia sp. NPDC051756 TaxID=3154751 RepID=UPI0034234D4A
MVSLVLITAGVWWWREHKPGPNPALTLADQVTIDGFTRLTTGVIFDNPPSAYATYIGDTNDHILDQFHAPGIRIIPRSDPTRDPPPDSIVLAVGDAPHGCSLTLERFLPTAAPYARHGVTRVQAANLENGTQTKLQLKILCPG